MAAEDPAGHEGTALSATAASWEEEDIPASGRPIGLESVRRTPLYQAQHTERYGRQRLIAEYERISHASLIVLIDQIFPDRMTYLEELLFGLDKSKPLHLLLASPGGDGETAIRMVRSMQARCSELTVLVPDMAKSAATLICLGANHIVMGPGGDLGPVDPQFQLDARSLASAKDIVAAVAEAEERVRLNPETYTLYASLLADVNMLKVEEARSSLSRTGALVREALASHSLRSDEDVETLAQALQAPLIDEPRSHSAVISSDAASKFGLPVTAADPDSDTWFLVWSLWTRYFAKGCFPAGNSAVYEARRASHLVQPWDED